ncbi:LysE family transporter [Nesterenkonia sp.]|uniref:LysE/ArgO family amino acid transporter n=1 Tax=Nesterenkonia sp. TaxID=704201 RepID=UPI00262F8CC5|nr:LysE family transporter [Nesterenkonia sp.]
MLTVLLTGFLTCMAIIVAIGPQSAFVLRQGLRRDRVMLTIGMCLLGDVILISLGTAGVGAVLEHAPWLLDVLRWVGVVYLLWFAARSFRSAWAAGRATRSQASAAAETVHVAMTSELPQVNPDGGQRTTTQQKVQVTSVSKISTVAGTALTLSLVNPHSWVDCVVVLGTMANSFGDQRWIFAAGTLLACVLWHGTLAGGASALAGFLNRPRTWQIIDAAVGVIMVFVAGMLAFSGF